LWTAICPISGSGLSPARCQPFCLSSLCLLNVPVEISSLPLSPSLVHLQHPAPLLHVPFQFLVYYSVFLWGRGSVCPGGYAGLSKGWLWEYHMMLICSPVGLLGVSQAGLEMASGRWRPSFFLSVTWCGEALYGLEVQGVKVLIFLGAFFSC
jgi:hypothetical protein